MRRDRRHSRTFRSTNEYSLYRNRIYLLNALCAAQQNSAVRKKILDWFRYEEELESLVHRGVSLGAYRLPSLMHNDGLKPSGLRLKSCRNDNRKLN